MTATRPSRALLLVAAIMTCTAWPAAALLWFRAGEKAFAVSVFGLGLSLGPCLAAYAVVPVRKKSFRGSPHRGKPSDDKDTAPPPEAARSAASARRQAARRVVLFTGGLSIMAFGLLGAANLDLEGFFMLLFAGTMGAAIGHTMITVIAGPLVFGRLLCGWGCWRAMVLELLPIRENPGRHTGFPARRSENDLSATGSPAPRRRRRAARSALRRFLPAAGLAASAGGAALSFYVLGHHPGGTPASMHAGSVGAVAAGFAIYYTASIGLAFVMRDQRAFCKYLCPNSAILRVTSRPALMKMAAVRDLCNRCGACSRVCPMDIDVAHFAVSGGRVLSGDCILCQRCAEVCPTGAVRVSFRPNAKTLFTSRG